MSRARDTADQINRVNSSAADATAITVDSSENVGIGTSSSLTNLSVAGAESGVLSRVNVDVADSQNRTLTLSEQKITFAAPNTYGTNYNAFINYGLTSLQFGSGNTERIRIDSDGLKFNGDTAAANALDDYEEGTWTPRIVGSSSESGQSYQRQTGHYTKIGNQVFCRFILNFSSRGTFSGDYIMDGFPFNFEAPADIHLCNLYHSYVGQNVISVGLYNRQNDNKAYIWIKTQAGQSREYPNSSFLTNDTELSGSFTLQTTA